MLDVSSNHPCYSADFYLLNLLQCRLALAMYHLWRHPVGVSYDRVTLPAVMFAEF